MLYCDGARGSKWTANFGYWVDSRANSIQPRKSSGNPNLRQHTKGKVEPQVFGTCRIRDGQYKYRARALLGKRPLCVNQDLPVESGESRIEAKAKLRQPSQQEGAKKADSPQFKQIGGGGWAGSRKSPLAPIRPSPDYTGNVFDM